MKPSLFSFSMNFLFDWTFASIFRINLFFFFGNRLFCLNIYFCILLIEVIYFLKVFLDLFAPMNANAQISLNSFDSCPIPVRIIKSISSNKHAQLCNAIVQSGEHLNRPFFLLVFCLNYTGICK